MEALSNLPTDLSSPDAIATEVSNLTDLMAALEDLLNDPLVSEAAEAGNSTALADAVEAVVQAQSAITAAIASAIVTGSSSNSSDGADALMPSVEAMAAAQEGFKDAVQNSDDPEVAEFAGDMDETSAVLDSLAKMIDMDGNPGKKYRVIQS